MKYTIISRDELIKLIKFGTIYQGINSIFDEKNRYSKIEELLKALPYDDELGFVIVEFTYDETSSFDSIRILMKLNIKDIISIYCLSNQALNFYKTKFNPNIKFKLFENLKLIENINKYKVIEDKKKGVKALSEIFKLEIKSNQDILDEKYIQELLDYKEIGYLEQEFKSFYHDMFCYERKNSFFKEDIGFLCDYRTILAVKDRKNKENLGNDTYTKKLLENYSQEKNNKLQKITENFSLKIQESKSSDEEKIKLINYLKSGIIFLKSKSLLDPENREENYWDDFLNLINEFKKDYPEETKTSLWYLGAFLGYKYLYDDYYKQLDLNIFKENSFSENNVNVLKETNPLELELEKVRNENKELMGKVKELENANAEVCIHKETEQNLPNNASDVDNEQTKDYIPQVVELKKQEKETEPNNEISELEKKIESNQELPDIQNHNNETINKKYFQFTDEEITKFSLSHLQDIARERGVETPTSNKKFPNSPEGKIALYNAIKALQKLDI